MSKLKVSLDLDGVVADIDEVVRLDYSAELGVPLYGRDCDSWCWLQDKYGCSEDEAWEPYRTVWVDHPPSDIPPLERDVSHLTHELFLLADVDIVTAHELDSEPNIKRWLTDNHIYYNNLKLIGYTDKTILPYDVWVDDYSKTAVKVVNKGKTALFMRSPYSLGTLIVDKDADSRNLISIIGLREAVDYVERRIAKEEFNL